MNMEILFSRINRTCATSGTGTSYPSGAPEFTSGFKWGSCYPIFSFMCMFCRSFFVLFLLAIVLPFFYLQILITPLVSSNSSYIASNKSHCLIDTYNVLYGLIYAKEIHVCNITHLWGFFWQMIPRKKSSNLTHLNC